MSPSALSLATPVIFAVAVLAGVAAVIVAIARRVAMPRSALAMFAGALVCACLAAGGLTWRHERVGRLAVVVDVSPSTAGATFRDADKLAARLQQSLGGRTRYSLHQLADGVKRTASADLRSLPRHTNVPQTAYEPPADADAVVLFTDARFAGPSSLVGPPTFVVRDPALDEPPDARIERLELRGGNELVATVSAAAAGRTITFDGTDAKRVPVEVGRTVVTAKLRDDAPPLVSAYVLPRDRWTANDVLALRRPPPALEQRWWVGRGAPPGPQWTKLGVDQVPVEPADFLGVAVVVLDNVAADELNGMQRWRLHQYVRDLGGGVVILGGDRAFAAGRYTGCELDAISPLASTPPQPAAQWMLLADSSGSMARSIGDNSRWAFAVNAIARVIPLLPGDDTIAVGSFSQALRWFVAGKSVREAQAGFAWPKDLRPGGPTNLAAALTLIADTADGALPTQLLVITDGEAKFDAPDQLADALAAKRVRLYVIAGGGIGDDNPLRRVVARTGGEVAAQPDPRKWAAELRKLTATASPPWLERSQMTAHFTSAGPPVPPQTVTPPWNRTWLKRDATELATGEVAGSGDRVPAVAAWNLGSGAVIAAAFAPTPAVSAALAARAERPPRDPRFRVAHDAGRDLRVTLEAAEVDGAYMNGLTPRVLVSAGGDDAATSTQEPLRMMQIGPGRYEASVPAPSAPAFIAVAVNGRVIDRFAVAGRYPPEYETIGNDPAAMASLARATGGAVIEPTQTTPIDFRWPIRRIPLAPHLAAASGLLTLGGLVRWKLS